MGKALLLRAGDVVYKPHELKARGIDLLIVEIKKNAVRDSDRAAWRELIKSTGLPFMTFYQFDYASDLSGLRQAIEVWRASDAEETLVAQRSLGMLLGVYTIEAGGVIPLPQMPKKATYLGDLDAFQAEILSHYGKRVVFTTNYSTIDQYIKTPAKWMVESDLCIAAATVPNTRFWNRYVFHWNKFNVITDAYKATGVMDFPGTIEDLKKWSANQSYQFPGAIKPQEPSNPQNPVEQTETAKRLASAEQRIEVLEQILREIKNAIASKLG